MARFAQGLPAHLWIAVLLSLTYSCFTWFLRIYARVGYYGIDDVAITIAHVSVLHLTLAFSANSAGPPTILVWHELPCFRDEYLRPSQRGYDNMCLLTLL